MSGFATELAKYSVIAALVTRTYVTWDTLLNMSGGMIIQIHQGKRVVKETSVTMNRVTVSFLSEPTE